MTGQELMDWVKKHHAEKMKVVVQYRDLELGGFYPGFDEDLEPKVDELHGKEVIVL